MPIPSKLNIDFVENNIYHIYNRTNNKEKLFLIDENYLFFLKQYAKYINPVAETFCWCLLRNHFHFLIRIKPIEKIKELLKEKETQEITNNLNHINEELILTKKQITLSITEKKFLKNSITLIELVEHYFKNFFQSYSLSFNKMHNRSGNLFYKPFKRLEINKESHFTQAVIYIHANALKHNLCKDFTKYKWSSWHTYISKKETLLNRNELLEWFGGLENFISTHKKMTNFYFENETSIEDDC